MGDAVITPFSRTFNKTNDADLAPFPIGYRPGGSVLSHSGGDKEVKASAHDCVAETELKRSHREKARFGENNNRIAIQCSAIPTIMSLTTA